MFAWLRRLCNVVVERYVRHLAAKNQALRAEWRALHGDEPVPLTPQERQRLKELRKTIDPVRRKALGLDDDVFRLDDDA